jgi:ribosomal protein L23
MYYQIRADDNSSTCTFMTGKSVTYTFTTGKSVVLMEAHAQYTFKPGDKITKVKLFTRFKHLYSLKIINISKLIICDIQLKHASTILLLQMLHQYDWLSRRKSICDCLSRHKSTCWWIIVCSNLVVHLYKLYARLSAWIQFTNIRQPMLKLKTHSGFREFFRFWYV